jgi:hypothetical protein
MCGRIHELTSVKLERNTAAYIITDQLPFSVIEKIRGDFVESILFLVLFTLRDCGCCRGIDGGIIVGR